MLSGGFRPGELIVLAGRPGCGKSTLAQQIAWTRAKAGSSVWFASCEMSSVLCLERLLASEARVASTAVHSGKLASTDWSKLAGAVDRILRVSSMYVQAYSGGTVSDIRLDALRHRAKHGLHCVVVDYLQLLRGPGRTKYERVSEVSTGLKQLGLELDVPVLALCQLRRLESANARPTMADLRDSGQIEQDADTILLLHRDDKSPTVECIVEKQRSGPTGEIELVFDKAIYTFEDA
jgi:replicative DNA helicase